jgi:hypothetical protein
MQEKWGYTCELDLMELFLSVMFVGPLTQPADVRAFSEGSVLFTFLTQSEMPRPTWNDSFVVNANVFGFLLSVTRVQHFLSNLFAEDAEGIAFERIIGQRNQMKALAVLMRENPERARRFYHEIETVYRQNPAAEKNELHLRNRKALSAIGVDLIPHHGFETRGSQRIVSYLINKHLPPTAFVASSTAIPMDRLPPRSSWQTMDREIEH